MNGNDERELVCLENLDRVYFFVDRILHQLCQETAADSARAVQTDIQDSHFSDKFPAVAVVFEVNRRFSPTGKLDAADQRRIIRARKSDRRKDFAFAETHRRSQAFDLAQKLY